MLILGESGPSQVSDLGEVFTLTGDVSETPDARIIRSGSRTITATSMWMNGRGNVESGVASTTGRSLFEHVPRRTIDGKTWSSLRGARTKP